MVQKNLLLATAFVTFLCDLGRGVQDECKMIAVRYIRANYWLEAGSVLRSIYL